MKAAVVAALVLLAMGLSAWGVLYAAAWFFGAE